MGELVWDERLMSREEFWRLAADLQIRPGIRRGLAFLDCTCGQAILPLGTTRNPFSATVLQIAGAILRHQVSAHDMPLNHRRTNGRDDTGADRAPVRADSPAGAGGRVPGRPGDRAVRRRPAAEAAGRHGKPGAAGGDRE